MKPAGGSVSGAVPGMLKDGVDARNALENYLCVINAEQRPGPNGTQLCMRELRSPNHKSLDQISMF